MVLEYQQGLIDVDFYQGLMAFHVSPFFNFCILMPNTATRELVLLAPRSCISVNLILMGGDLPLH